MRSRSLSFLIFLTLAAFAAQASATPQGGYTWFTPVAGWSAFANNIGYPYLGDSLKDGPIFGARLGRSLGSGGWGIELAGVYAAAKEEGHDVDVTYMNFSGNLVYTPISWPLGAPFVEIGGGVTDRKSDGFDKIDYGSFEQAVGWNAWMGEKVALRLEARNVLLLPNENFGAANSAEQQYLGGLTFAFGGKPRDTDGDGVPDKKDKCPNTPAGATVNATGCPVDSDGDGVWDGLDKCLGTPSGAAVDASGCPKDSDGDGVYDGIDKCADSPKGATVDATGCPKDSDGDGVFDGLDQCPNTPTGAKVDSRGCPIDSDGDGVPDGLDKCANTAQGLKVDTDGCPIEVTEKETQLLDTGMIRLQGVNFETGKSELLPESYAALDEVGTILRKWPQLQIEIGGHTDARGTAVSNQKLSESRAESVRSYLLSKFSDIKPEQLSAKGYGETKPIAPNNNALNMSKNRRVEFVVMNKDVLKKEIEKRKLLSK
jgi:outer membrane protein OmpA-like peptidoglycan-associated protein